MPEAAIAEQPKREEGFTTSAFDRMQAFLRKAGKTVSLELEDTKGIEVATQLYRQDDFYPYVNKRVLDNIKTTVLMRALVPKKHRLALLVTQRADNNSNATPSNIIGQFIITTGDEEEGGGKKTLAGTEVLAFTLTGDRKSRRRATLTTNQWSKARNLLNLSQKQWSLHGERLFWTDSEEEAQKIVDTIILSEESQSLVPIPNRRKLLKLAAVAGGLTVAGPILAKIPDLLRQGNAEFPQDPDLILRKSLENKFNILIKEEEDQFYDSSNPKPNTKSPIVYPEWNQQSLLFLEKTLSLLPAHFYHPDSAGRLPVFVLVRGNGGECQCGATTGSVFPHSIRLGIADADPETNFLEYYPAVVHELVHLKTSGPDENDKLLNMLPEVRNKVGQILGSDFPVIRDRLWKEVIEKMRPYVKEQYQKDLLLIRAFGLGDKIKNIAKDGLNEAEFERLKFYGRLHYGVAYLIVRSDTPVEFVAVMGEIYLNGKDYFKKYYGEFFEPEIVERLYDFVKDDIFRGREY